jgi:hypothetical protein
LISNGATCLRTILIYVSENHELHAPLSVSKKVINIFRQRNEFSWA